MWPRRVPRDLLSRHPGKDGVVPLADRLVTSGNEVIVARKVSTFHQEKRAAFIRHLVNDLPRQGIERVFSKLGPEGEILGMDPALRAPYPKPNAQAAAQQQQQ